MSIITDQATVDRWLAAGMWEQFAEGGKTFPHGKFCVLCISGEHRTPPADWTEAPPCETCGGDTWIPIGESSCMGCPDCGGSGKQREVVQVPCERCRIVDESVCPAPGCEGRAFDKLGLITVAWATQTWGPLLLLRNQDVPPDNGCWLEAFGPHSAIRYDDHDQQELLHFPPNVDTSTLIGQWARGGTIERNEA